MGDMSAEPSMEDILSSIKRIIAEEGEGAQARGRRPRAAVASAAAPPAAAASDEEVLELSNPMPVADPELDTPVKMTRPPAEAPPQPRIPEPQTPAPAKTPPQSAIADPIMSQRTAAASRGALETLSKLMVKPEAGTDGTLEGLVRELLRPMLRDWLDANLPELVEGLVAHEIDKITGSAR